ncbi:unnamed protein product [Phytomonas sp. Hart1]|nr:unnamed protein product [Phytomonas sp. Hart1]|eukprot:CCW66397.1 unnamed protein product [Phytomonas sp. isolate Hart1]
MTWHLKGRQAVASLDPATRYRITRSQVMAQCANKPLLWVLEELTRVFVVGGLSGPLHKVEHFLCLITRLLQICPSPDIVLVMLRQELHKYVKVAALFVIRLIGNDIIVQEAVKLGLNDYRKIRVYGSDETPAMSFVTTGTKRPRDTDDDGGDFPVEKQKDESDAIENLEPPHYFVLRMDELTERLFQLNQPRDVLRSKSIFLGVPLPGFVDLPHIL